MHVALLLLIACILLASISRAQWSARIPSDHYSSYGSRQRHLSDTDGTAGRDDFETPTDDRPRGNAFGKGPSKVSDRGDAFAVLANLRDTENSRVQFEDRPVPRDSHETAILGERAPGQLITLLLNSHPIAVQDYLLSLEKGAQFLCLFDDPVLTGPSQWTSYDEISAWGWEINGANSGDADYSHSPGIVALVGEEAAGKGTKVQWVYYKDKEPMDKDGKRHFCPASGAEYWNIFYPQHSLIVAFDNTGPAHGKARKESLGLWPQRGELPQLRQWSDVVYLTWSHALSSLSPAQRKPLRYFMRRLITNQRTLHTAKVVMWKRGVLTGKAGMWAERVMFGLEDPGFMALLGTPNVGGVVWLLLQHKDQLGDCRIEKISIWDDDAASLYGLSMLIEVGLGGEQA